MEGSEMDKPIFDQKSVENLKRIAKILAEGRPLDLKLNGRRVFFSEEARVEVELENNMHSKTWEVDIRWGEPRGERKRRKIGARVIPPLT